MEYINKQQVMDKLAVIYDLARTDQKAPISCAISDINDLKTIDIEKLIQARLRGIQKTKLDALQSSDHNTAYMMLGAEKVCNEILDDVVVITGNKI